MKKGEKDEEGINRVSENMEITTQKGVDLLK